MRPPKSNILACDFKRQSSMHFVYIHMCAKFAAANCIFQRL